MDELDAKEFGQRIKDFRIEKGYSQDNLASILNRDRSIISKYESGTVIPNAMEISSICKALDIYEADLFGNYNLVRTMKHEKSKNPFGTNRIYVYFNAFNFRTKKFGPDKYILDVEQKQDICKAKFIDYHDGRTYSEGYLMCNDEIVFAVMENYQATSSRVDVSVLEININNGVDELMLGGYFGTNAKCEPSLRKCYFSKKDIDFTDEMFEKLKLDENEKEIINSQNAMYLDIFKE